VKPADGFLIIASELGFNDSIDHGVPSNHWPVVNARQGQNVTIVVCNSDPAQPHGFQIDNYYDARLVAIAPNQALKISFVASKVGTFRIYCNIPCTVHWAMQSGELVVA
jgi:nitrous oxide reductase